MRFVLLLLLCAVPARAEMDCAVGGGFCARAQRVVKAWGLPWTDGLKLVAAPGTEAVNVHPAEQLPETEAALALARSADALAGPCRYDETEERIEVAPVATGFSDAGLASCLAAALVQARYVEIESRWLSHLGERETWVVRRGVLTRVSVAEGIDPPGARAVWGSLAKAELMGSGVPAPAAEPALPAEPGPAAARGIASERSGDGVIRELLEMR